MNMNNKNTKMKRIVILFAAAVLLAGACNDDYLERTPGSAISDGNFWMSVSDLRLYCNNFYNNYLPNYNGWGSMGIYSLDQADGTDTYIAPSFNRTMNGETLLTSSDNRWSSGGSGWAPIRNVNYFLANYKKVNAGFNEIQQYVGEALFFRSMLYFERLKTFGDLPFISAVLNPTSEELYDARLPRNQVVDSLMRDLDLAVQYLPARSGFTGRLNRETAMLLQARIALYEGTWEKYHAGTPFGVQGQNGAKFLQKAAEVSKQLIDGGTCDLDNKDGNVDDPYWNLFNQEDYSNSREVLFWRRYERGVGAVHIWQRCFGDGGDGGLTKSMIESYLDIEGKPIAVSTVYDKGNETLAEIVANRDPRLAQSIFTPGDIRLTGSSAAEAVNGVLYWEYPTIWYTLYRNVTGYQLRKGQQACDYSIYLANSVNGAIYYRYGEALLIYAEARAEMDAITQEDVDMTINALRKRAGMTGLLTLGSITPDPNWEFPELSPIINEVRRERKVELLCEGFRKDDIFRWAAADKLIVGYKPLGAKRAQWENDPTLPEEFVSAFNSDFFQADDDGYIDPWKNTLPTGYNFRLDKDYLSPLPTDQITLNPNLKQNPGW